MKKKLQAIICGALLLCAGIVISACAPTDAEFNAKDITVSGTEFVYDGSVHNLEITYPEVDASVSYSLDNETFGDAASLAIKNAGTYKVYYKLTAEGFKDYLGETSVVVGKKDVTVVVDDAWQIKSQPVTTPTSTVTGVVAGDDLGLTYQVEGLPTENFEAGKTYTIHATAANANYNAVVTEGTYHVVDYVEIVGTPSTFASTLGEAYAAIENGATLKLHGNVVLENCLNVQKTFTLDGQGKYAVVAGEGMTEDKDVQMIKIKAPKASPVTVTFKDVILNANSKCRVITVTNNDTLKIEGATITGGQLRRLDINHYAPGVFVTSAARFVMTSGTIAGNKIADDCVEGSVKKTDYYVVESQDLWVGANAFGNLQSSITGGTIGKMFVNSNSYSATNPGKFTMEGGTVESVYVEYDKNYEATFEYKDGIIGKLMIAKQTVGEGEETYVVLTPVKGTTYKGGTLNY